MTREINHKKWREKNGRLLHDADCYFWGTKICTCGLLHHLMPVFPYEQNDMSIELAQHERQLDRVPSPEPYTEPTEEEMKQRRKLLLELFPEFGEQNDQQRTT